MWRTFTPWKTQGAVAKLKRLVCATGAGRDVGVVVSADVAQRRANESWFRIGVQESRKASCTRSLVVSSEYIAAVFHAVLYTCVSATDTHIK